MPEEQLFSMNLPFVWVNLPAKPSGEPEGNFNLSVTEEHQINFLPVTCLYYMYCTVLYHTRNKQDMPSRFVFLFFFKQNEISGQIALCKSIINRHTVKKKTNRIDLHVK